MCEFNNSWSAGEFLWLGWENGINDISVILTVEFYDQDGNLMGSGHVEILN